MLRCKQTNLRQLYRLELWVTAAFGPGPGTHWHQNNCSLSLFQQKQIHLTEREEQRRPTTLTVTERQSSNIRPWAPPGPSLSLEDKCLQVSVIRKCFAAETTTTHTHTVCVSVWLVLSAGVLKISGCCYQEQTHSLLLRTPRITHTHPLPPSQSPADTQTL